MTLHPSCPVLLCYEQLNPLFARTPAADLAEYASSSPDLCASPKTRNLITPELQNQSLALALEVEQTLAHDTAKNSVKNDSLETGLYWLENSTLLQRKTCMIFSI